MNIRKVIQRRLRATGPGLDAVADVNAAVAANVRERGGVSSTSSRQVVVQRDGRTAVSESTSSNDEGGTQ